LVWKKSRVVRSRQRTPVRAIEAAGLRPVVIEPMLQMENILKRWGWYRQVVGSGINRQTQWRPRRVYRSGLSGLHMPRASP
jgi:hypothetical protein